MTRLILIWILLEFLLISSWLIRRAIQYPVNQTMIDDHDDNETIIIAASPNLTQPNDPLSQFNDRRRDMFFEDYSVKQIQVVDTVAITNNSINGHGNRIKNNVSTNNKKPLIPPMESLNPNLIPTKLSEIETIESSNKISNSTMLSSEHWIKPQRINLLLPKLEHETGKPSCLQTPDDTFCENVDNYPKGVIKEEVEFSPDQFSEIFGSKEIDGRTIMDVENDESVCHKIPRVIYPKMAKNQANQWIYVVNEVEYTQAVVAEICQRPGKSCAYMENLPLGMISRCKQKYSYKRLLALHPTEKRTYPDAFRFPSCCSCYIKTVDDFMARTSAASSSSSLVNFRKIDKPTNVIDTASKEEDSIKHEMDTDLETNLNVSTTINSKNGSIESSSNENDNNIINTTSISTESIIISATTTVTETHNNNNNKLMDTTTFLPVATATLMINQSFVIN